jgi:NitT/TauT family transport system ATP-binding protein
MIASLDNVTVNYARGPVLGPFSLALDEAEIVALVGPSGCGKSTALRLLAGLEEPTSGTVARTAARGETAVVFQSPTLMPWASVVTNVALPLELAGLGRADARSQATQALARVGLAGQEACKPAQLSGGMAMRAAIARAMISRPKLLLLDEPFAALDEITRRDLADDVHRLWAAERPAIVFVTHSVEEAVYMARRVIVLSPGPGQAAGEVALGGDIPRKKGFRTTPAFRTAAETVSSLLAASMGRAA